MIKSEGTGGWHQDFFREDTQSHPRMPGMRAGNQHQQETGA